MGILFGFSSLAMGWQLLGHLTRAEENAVSQTWSIEQRLQIRTTLLEIERQLPDAQGERRQSLLDQKRFMERQLEAEPVDQVKTFAMNPEWPRGPRQRQTLTRTLGWLISGVMVLSLLLSLGAANRDLSRATGSMEWLFSMPIPTGWIFAAQWLQYGLILPILWVAAWPILSLWFWVAGSGPWGIVLAAATCVYIGLMVGAARLAVETWLRTAWEPAKVKNLQALITLGGMVGIASMMAVIYQPRAAVWLKNFASAGGSWILLQPLGVPAMLTEDGARIPLALGVMGAYSFLAGVAGVAICKRITRNGLSRQSQGSYLSNVRSPGRKERSFQDRPIGIIGKELRLVVRDRNFLAQTVIAPAFVFGIQLIVNPGIIRAATDRFDHAATLAYALGAYTLAVAGARLLSGEGRCLWLLYTVPRSLHKILARKALLWSAVSLFYPTCVLILAWMIWPDFRSESVWLTVLALGGIGVFSFTAAGMGILATDPLEPENHKKVQPGMIWLYMILAGSYMSVFYLPDLWTRIQIVLFSALMAFAIWEKAGRRLPFLLDPVSRAPGAISASDGIIAIYALQALQYSMLLGLIALDPDPPQFETILTFQTVSYALASLIVAVTTLRILAKRGIRITRPQPGSPRPRRSAGSGLLAGLALGGLCAAGALAYLLLLPDRLKDPIRVGVQPDLGSVAWWMLFALTVIMAPLIEEFLFRRLLLSGLLDRWKPWAAILASAVAFALIHPLASIPPVLALGLATGWVYHKSRSLPACMLSHAVYNAVVISAGV
jgi:hypothetical protein